MKISISKNIVVDNCKDGEEDNDDNDDSDDDGDDDDGCGYLNESLWFALEALFSQLTVCLLSLGLSWVAGAGGVCEDPQASTGTRAHTHPLPT